MNDPTRDITGGDLYSLWRVAHITLPTVENVYVDQANVVHEIDEPDDVKFGRCHPWWATLCSELEQALFISAVRLRTSASALDRAVENFSHVDGDNAKGLNKIGEELKDILNDANLHDKDDELTGDERPGDVEAPNWTTPEGWYTND